MLKGCLDGNDRCGWYWAPFVREGMMDDGSCATFWRRLLSHPFEFFFPVGGGFFFSLADSPIPVTCVTRFRGKIGNPSMTRHVSALPPPPFLLCKDWFPLITHSVYGDEPIRYVWASRSGLMRRGGVTQSECLPRSKGNAQGGRREEARTGVSDWVLLLSGKQEQANDCTSVQQRGNTR